MNTEDIGKALVETRDFIPVEATEFTERQQLTAKRYDFVGVRQYWGSMFACGLVSVVEENEAKVGEIVDEFYLFSRSLRNYSGHLGTRLGAFGLLVIIVEGPASSRFRNAVAAQKRGSAWHGDYCLVWLLDRSSREVFRHRGFPLTMFPGKRFFKHVLSREGAG